MKREFKSDQPVLCIVNSKAESKWGDCRALLNLLWDEIKEIRNDIKIYVEKIRVFLLTNANYIIKSQEPENEGLNVDNKVNPI